jgi:transcriptional antiterminator Rof (Rho-off)
MDAEGAYRPIACDYHDDLEAYAVTKRRVRILHVAAPDPGSAAPAAATSSAPATSDGAIAQNLLRSEGRIEDIYTTADKEEFLRLDDGTLVRLDRIQSVEALA